CAGVCKHCASIPVPLCACAELCAGVYIHLCWSVCSRVGACAGVCSVCAGVCCVYLCWSMCWTVYICVGGCVPVLEHVLECVYLCWSMCWSVCTCVGVYVGACAGVCVPVLECMHLCWSVCRSLWTCAGVCVPLLECVLENVLECVHLCWSMCWTVYSCVGVCVPVLDCVGVCGPVECVGVMCCSVCTCVGVCGPVLECVLENVLECVHLCWSVCSRVGACAGGDLALVQQQSPLQPVPLTRGAQQELGHVQGKVLHKLEPVFTHGVHQATGSSLAQSDLHSLPTVVNPFNLTCKKQNTMICNPYQSIYLQIITTKKDI
uniref:Uncharacterized protein n=1 Tax=Astyanax mexicanus TaxID=7994 RepID=A0A3B1IPT8_ASTMX